MPLGRREPRHARLLRHKALVERRVRFAAEAGGADYKWVARGVLRCAVEPLRPEEAAEAQHFAGAQVRTATHRIRCRASRTATGIAASDRIVWRDKILTLVGLPVNPSGDGKWLLLHAKEQEVGVSAPEPPPSEVPA